MRVVIAHRSSVQKARLRVRLAGFPGVNVVRIVSELHETYHFAEHHRPDCILISASLANRPEFELLAALLRILSIRCIILHDTDEVENFPCSTRTGPHIIRISCDAPDPILRKVLENAPDLPVWPPATDDYNRQRHSVDPFRIVLIGSSTGGVDALLRIISGFPADCPPTLIVQHTGGSYARSLIRLLDGATPAKVLPAQNGQNLSRGEIYLAPDDMAHLQLCPSRSRQILLKPGPPVSGHRPSVDALFQSALDYADEITAALLTGMGRDGAAGITALRRAGARTIGQDAATSVVYGMPRVAKQMGGIETELPLSMIGPALLQVSRTTVAT